MHKTKNLLAVSMIALMASASGCEMAEDDVAEAREPITQKLNTTPELKRGEEPGELIVDARSGRDVFVMSEKGMAFDSKGDLYKFLGEKLNADPVLNKEGKVTGMRGQLVSYGTPYFADAETKTVYAVDDYIEALLGGRNGIMTVDKEPYCIRPNICGDTKKVGSRATVCEGPFCASGESFRHEAPPLRPFFVRVGAVTRQEVGGYTVKRSLCWNGPIPWICSTEEGGNTLRVGAGFRFNPLTPPPLDYRSLRPRTVQNAESVSVAEWGIGIIGGDGLPAGICSFGSANIDNPPPVVCSIDDVCAAHYADADQGGPVGFNTDISDFCDAIAVPEFEIQNPFSGGN